MGRLKVDSSFLSNLKHLTTFFWFFEWVRPLINSIDHLLSNEAPTIIVILFLFAWMNANDNILAMSVFN